MKIFKCIFLIITIAIFLLPLFSCETFIDILKKVICNSFDGIFSSVKIGNGGIMFVNLVDNTTDIEVEPYTKLYADIITFLEKNKVQAAYKDNMIVYKLE